MKIKQFFVVNKDKIKKLFQFLLCVFGILFYTISIFACGYNLKTAIEDTNKKELVNRKERINSSDIPYINLITDNELSNLSNYYYNTSNTQVDDTNYRTTPRISVYPSSSYVVGNTAGETIYLTYYNVNVVRVSTIAITGGVFTTPSNALYVRVGTLATSIDTTWFYQGSYNYDYYVAPLDRILNDEYDEGYESGFYDSTNNLFQPQHCKLLIKQGYLYKSYGEVDSILGNGYFNKNLFFLGNHLDFSYLYIALRADGLFQTALEFMISFDSNIRFYLSNLNLKVVPSDSSPIPIVENLNLVVSTDGQLGESSQLFEFLEYDKLYRYDNRNLIESFWFSNYWPDSEVYLYNVMTYEVESFNKGFDSGFDKGYSSGYLQGEIDQDDYYNNLIIPSIKIEYEELGYSNGYDVGFVDGKGVGYDEGLSDGRLENNAILKPFELMVKGVEPVIVVLSSEIAPGITIGTIALIPLAVAMIVFLLKGLVL